MKDSLILLCVTVLTKNFWYILVVVARIAGRGMISHEKGRLYIQHFHLCNRYTTKEYYHTSYCIVVLVWTSYCLDGWQLFPPIYSWILVHGKHTIGIGIAIWNTIADWLYRSSIFTRIYLTIISYASAFMRHKSVAQDS
jgi:hypothetical protein